MLRYVECESEDYDVVAARESFGLTFAYQDIHLLCSNRNSTSRARQLMILAETNTVASTWHVQEKSVKGKPRSMTYNQTH
jgi:hypothetical protein